MKSQVNGRLLKSKLWNVVLEEVPKKNVYAVEHILQRELGCAASESTAGQDAPETATGCHRRGKGWGEGNFLFTIYPFYTF